MRFEAAPPRLGHDRGSHRIGDRTSDHLGKCMSITDRNEPPRNVGHDYIAWAVGIGGKN